MKRRFFCRLVWVATLVAFVAGCKSTDGVSRTTERAEVRAVYRPVSDDAEISLSYSIEKD